MGNTKVEQRARSTFDFNTSLIKRSCGLYLAILKHLCALLETTERLQYKWLTVDIQVIKSGKQF